VKVYDEGSSPGRSAFRLLLMWSAGRHQEAEEEQAKQADSQADHTDSPGEGVATACICVEADQGVYEQECADDLIDPAQRRVGQPQTECRQRQEDSERRRLRTGEHGPSYRALFHSRSIVGLLLFAGCALWTGTVRGASPDPSNEIDQIEQLLDEAQDEIEEGPRFDLADRALAGAEKLAAKRPTDPKPPLLAAQALSMGIPGHPERCRPGMCERAVERLQKARTLDRQGLHAEAISSELGIALSRLGRHEAALAEYERALTETALARRPERLVNAYGRSILMANSAESLMALGRLEPAITRYRESAALVPLGSLEWQLASWGLGVALDRDGQIERSREVIGRVLERDPTMAHLADSLVFFEPPGDKFYYKGLGHEIAGDSALALENFRQFLVELPSSRHAARTRAHIEQLSRLSRGSSELDRLFVEVGTPLTLQEARPPLRLRKAMRLHEDELRLCYLRGVRNRKSPPAGALRLEIEIAPWGSVMQEKVVSSTLGMDDLDRCIELSAAAWNFPAAEGSGSEQVVVELAFGIRP
jgi:tetratricopeptide (TPR) repeat protein